MLKLKPIAIEDFSGGHVTSAPLLRDAKYSPDCLNVYSPFFKTLKKRLGYSRLNSVSGAATGSSIYEYVQDDSIANSKLMSNWGAVLKKMDVVTSAWDGTWDTISASANGTAFTSGTTIYFTTFNGDCVFTTEDRNVPQKYDPDDNSGEYTNLHYGGSGTAPSGKYCLTWHDCVWIANTSSNPDRLTRSASADHTDWSGATLDYYQDFITSGDAGITGLAKLRGLMYVFKKNSIHRVTWIGGTPTLDIKEVKSAIGTASPRSIVNIEIQGKGEMIIFLGSDSQLYMFNGWNAVPIGEPIYNYNGISTHCLKGDASTYGINYKYFNKVHAVNKSYNHHYEIFFPKDNDTTCKDSYIYDYYTGAFWPNTYADAINDSAEANDGAGQRKVYTIGVNYSWLHDDGNDDDDDTDISAKWDSMKIDGGSEVVLKRSGFLSATHASNAATPILSYRADWDSSYTALVTMTASTNRTVEDLPLFENFIQLRIADSSSAVAFELYRLVATQQGRGEGQ